MINYSELKDVFNSKTLSIYEYNVETDEIVDLPFIVYRATDGDFFQADGQNYIKFLSVTMGMFDQTMNCELQRKIESVLDEHSTYYDKSINFDEEQRIYTVSYTFDVFDDAEN